jgi:CRISPR/Cas system CMR-associated protein Cmr1 (group 7 of RAMP superfamily)
VFCTYSILIPYTSCYLEFEVFFCPAGKNPLDSQHVVVCYVAVWAYTRRGLGSFTVDNIAPTLCTHLVYANANLNILKNAIESSSPEYDLEENNGTGWCIGSTVWIVICVNLSQVQEVQ